MPTTSAKDMNFSRAKIIEMLGWPHFNGFTAETCGKCKAPVNVIACNPGWFCPCGHYNNQSWSCSHIPWDNPTYGPTQATIRSAIKQVRGV